MRRTAIRASLACAAGLDEGSRDRRSWRRRGGCPTCCACHTEQGDKSEAPSDGSFAVPAARRHPATTDISPAWAAGLDEGSRDRRSWRRRGGCPTCCACHTEQGDKSEAPSDGSFAVPAARRYPATTHICPARVRAWMNPIPMHAQRASEGFRYASGTTSPSYANSTPAGSAACVAACGISCPMCTKIVRRACTLAATASASETE